VTGVERLVLRDLPARPWKNGGGTTREVACHPRGADYERFEWRVSVAEVASDGPFSAFPGVDRTIVLLDGAGLRLRDTGRGAGHDLTEPGVPWTFAGEAAIAATLVDGATRDFNVMTRRGCWSAEVRTVRSERRTDPADALLLLAVAGQWGVDGQVPIRPGELCLWRAPVASMTFSPATPAAPGWLLVVRLCQDRR